MSFVTLENNARLPFNKSISLSLSSNLSNFVNINQLKNGDVQITKSNETDGLELMRPSFCPFANLNNDQLTEISKSEKKKWISAAAVAIVQSSDDRVLLTKRAAHLRTFPNVWVPPGGHLDEKEQLQNCVLRELQEETGLNISGCCSITPLCAWESAYPTSLSFGLPTRHGLVVYFLIKVPFTSTTLLKVNLDEVSSYCWLDKNQIFTVVKSFSDPLNFKCLGEFNNQADKFECTNVFSLTSSDELNYKKEERPISVLLQGLDFENLDRERVSTGTKFALFHWLKQFSRGAS